MKRANGSEIHALAAAEVTLCVGLPQEKLSKRVMFLGPNKRLVFPRPNVNFHIQLVEGEEGIEIVLVFERMSAHAIAGADTHTTPADGMSFVLKDICDERLLEHLTAIAGNEKETESFFVAVGLEPVEGRPAANRNDDEIYLSALIGDFQTRSINPVTRGILAEYINLPEPERTRFLN
jgi:hypothetical protein